MTVDFLTKAERSERMARIRSRGNKTTEKRMMQLMRAGKITGWRRQARLPGSPDFVFPAGVLCVFVDGCFWHGCPSCYRPPSTNPRYWRNKVAENRRRDLRVSRQLRRMGYSVMRVRECRLAKSPEAVLARVRRMLGK